ncbi:MAG: hypothetical protein EPO35_05985 [Acidobacteria bacterium]|nr:MAG: hypothetical protein EPO35_05985 [Acidobacteriota bacterium]
MTECCGPAPGAPRGRPACTGCATAGAPVDLSTVKALLVEPALARLNTAVFYFCADTKCPVVYFAADGQRFLTSDVRARVWQKEPPGDRAICYCFGENERDIRAEIARDGASGAVNRVREHIAAHRCACEIRNPRGACCLGDVAEAVKRVLGETRLS